MSDGSSFQKGDKFWYYDEILVREDKVETRYSLTVWPRLGGEALLVSQLHRTEADAIRALLKDMAEAIPHLEARLAELREEEVCG